MYFFYRKLKFDARPIDNYEDPQIIVSAADCRFILFDNITEATRIWIKGHQFSFRYLFENEKLAQEFDGGSIAIKERLDVLTRNQRTVITIENDCFEMVAIGALLVGSVNFTVKSNQSIEKGDELGRIKK